MRPSRSCHEESRKTGGLFNKSIATLVLVFCASSILHAQITWDGGGSNSSWGTAGNWNPDGVPGSTDTALFNNTGASRTSPSVSAITTIGGIKFTGSTAYTFGGGSVLSIGTGGITNDSSVTQTINTDLRLVTGGQTWSANSGGLTFGSTASINTNGFRLTIDGGAGTAINGTISGTGGLTKNGSGTLILSNSNSFSGTTLVNEGTLTAGAANALSNTTSVTINNTGTLLLSGSTNNRINDSASLNLAGGTLNLAGRSEYDSVGTNSAGVGALTLSSDSFIDFGTTVGTNTILWFASGSRSGGTLTILNWTGSGTTAAGTDQLRFTSTSGLNATFLSNITFDGYAPGAQIVNRSGYSEVMPANMTPIPEPSTIVGAGLIVGTIGWRERRRLTKVPFRRS